MPWWAVTYLGSIVILATAAFLDHIPDLSRKKISIRQFILEWSKGLVTILIPIFFFLSFWFPNLVAGWGIASPLLLLPAIGWHIYSWLTSESDLGVEQTRLNPRQKRNILLALAVYESPLYIVSVIAMLRNYFH